MIIEAIGEHEITWGENRAEELGRLPPPRGPSLLDHPGASLTGGSDISVLMILIEFNCLLPVALKPFQSPLKLGNIGNATPQGFNLCPPQEQRLIFYKLIISLRQAVSREPVISHQ